MEKGISRKWNQEESKLAILISDKLNSTQNKAEKIERHYHTQRKNPRGYCNSKYLCTKHKDIQIHKRNITVGKTTHQPSHLNSD